MGKYLVFDWGGTFLKYAFMDKEGNILEKGKVPTPMRTSTKDAFLQEIDLIVNQFRCEMDGIAISSPGIIDSTKGILKVVGVFPYLRGCHIVDEFTQQYGVPVSLENDAKSAALAELWKGNLKDCKDGAVCIIGTSIGGGLVLDGKLRRGPDFFAGEYSSMCINLDRKKDRDGYMAMLGYDYICTRIVDALHLDHFIDGEQAFQYINEGNEKALHVLKEYTDALALQLFNINVLCDLEKICIGGGISKQPILLTYLKQSVEEIRNYHPDIVNGIDLPLPNVDVCKFYNEANLIGALYHFFEMYSGE